jgi:hypothetical protein
MFFLLDSEMDRAKIMYCLESYPWLLADAKGKPVRRYDAAVSHGGKEVNSPQ